MMAFPAIDDERAWRMPIDVAVRLLERRMKIIKRAEPKTDSRNVLAEMKKWA